ncbi:hemerythrin [Chlorella sorokiniana]|uniref:Hemerythrin n=1 Tax=Chlorella sorokiniana TaxID=3076 RepID=A0A2P6TSX5_CHLSO|nr:hemerythrin [Chlorella sorokiniana]|eukprot:PRW57159.1 hemerythrin [Chlorella sorokiniana]
MAPKSAEKKKASPKQASPWQPGGAAKRGQAARGRSATCQGIIATAFLILPSLQKSPAKKAKTEEDEVPAGAEEVEEEEAAEPAAAEEGGAQAASPAAHTRSKEGKGAGPSAAKKMAASAAENMLQPPTIADILLGDHRDTVALLKHHQEVADSGDKLLLEKLTDAIAITVRLHSQAEMDVLYPMVEKKLGGKGKELAAHAADDHAQIERDLVEALQKRKTGGEELAQVVQEVTEKFLHHLKEEEESMMPELLKKCTAEEQIELATAFMEAKAKAPLEPQPEAAAAQAAA